MTDDSMHADDGGDARLRDQAAHWCSLLQSGSATRADLEACKRWCAQSPAHAQAWRAERTAMAALDPAAGRLAQRHPEYLDRAQASAWRRLWMPQHRSGRRAFLGGAVAASAGAWLALRPPLGLWPSVWDYTADYRTATGEQRAVALGDQLDVQMNTQTRINVRRDPAAPELELLGGEAEINVAAGPAGWTVVAGAGRVMAREARFNVRYTGPHIMVACLEGSVRLAMPLGMELQAGQQAIYDGSGEVRRSTSDPEQISAWRQGALNFVDAPLSEVVAEINRYRPGKVLLRNAALARRTVRMRVVLSEVNDAVDLLSALTQAPKVELPGDIVVLG